MLRAEGGPVNFCKRVHQFEYRFCNAWVMTGRAELAGHGHSQRQTLCLGALRPTPIHKRQ